MKMRKPAFWLFCGILLLFCMVVSVSFGESGTDLVILTTTDMHGKCWETNIITGNPEPQNMLRVSTAVHEARRTYGEENVILIDNGDLLQGNPVSEVFLLEHGSPDDNPAAMVLCLREIGYDAMVLGNHEFSYPWETTCSVIDALRENGIAVLAANAYWDGTDGIHEAGTNAFGTWIIREVTVNGHPHKIGILGLENTDISRWDLPSKYPGIVFTSPGNPEYDMAKEANRCLARMREEGCEMFILCDHAGLGNGDAPVFLASSENQGLWILKNTDCLDLLVLGHDHSEAYSNVFLQDQAGCQVPVVNGGSQSLTRTVFRLTEDPDGGLTCWLQSTENLNLPDYEPDRDLEEMIRPYAEEASVKMDEPIARRCVGIRRPRRRRRILPLDRSAGTLPVLWVTGRYCPDGGPRVG